MCTTWQSSRPIWAPLCTGGGSYGRLGARNRSHPLDPTFPRDQKAPSLLLPSYPPPYPRPYQYPPPYCRTTLQMKPPWLPQTPVPNSYCDGCRQGGVLDPGRMGRVGKGQAPETGPDCRGCGSEQQRGGGIGNGEGRYRQPFRQIFLERNKGGGVCVRKYT